MSGEGKGQDPGRGEISPEDREAIRRRSQDIGRKLDAAKARARQEQDDEENRRRGAAFGQAFRYAAELVVGVGVGGFIGWLLDQQLGSAPWMLALFVLLGFAAGLLNLIRAAQKAQAENAPLQKAAPSVADDEDEKDN
ncbi:MAG TPA: AtpZ/AtpI family protein [Hyphomicrobium sp.]|nr:AtpZ/AtpI family protein [Hyphomicrobium sp.]